MRRIIHVTRNGTKYRVTLNTDKDHKLGSTMNHDDVSRPGAWIDYYAHVTKSGETYYYTHYQSCWEGDEDAISVESKEDLLAMPGARRYYDSDDEVVRRILEDDSVKEL